MDHILGYFLCLLGFLLAFIPLITFTGSALMQADRNRRKSQDSRRPGEGHLGSETTPLWNGGCPRPSLYRLVPRPCKGQSSRTQSGCSGVSVGFSSAQVRDETCHETSSRETQATQKLQDSGYRGSSATKQHHCTQALNGHVKWRSGKRLDT